MGAGGDRSGGRVSAVLFFCAVVHVVIIHGAQTVRDPDKSFLVASVKRSASQRAGMPALTPERLVLPGVTLRSLVKLAYSRPLPHQIEGGPRWFDSEYFDVEATMVAGTPVDDYWVMLRNLLDDRFKLVATVVTKEMSAEALIAKPSDGRQDVRIKRSPLDCSTIDPAETIARKPDEPRLCNLVTVSKRPAPGLRVITVLGRSVPMTALADYLSGARRVPVVDRTGLVGVFDFDLEFQSDLSDATTPSQTAAPRLATALEEQLGLVLRSARAPIDVLVIEKAEFPTPN